MTLTDEDKKRIQEEEDFRAQARATAQKQARTSAEKRKGMGCLLLLLIFALLFYSCRDNSPPQTPEQLKQREEAREKKDCSENPGMAYQMSKDFVTKILKAPTTAKFPWASEAKINTIGECKYDIRSYVDAQNSFGAQLRSKWHTVVQYKGNDHWAPLTVEMDK